MFKLIEPSKELEEEYIDYILEWENSGDKIVPAASRRNGLEFSELINKWIEKKTDKVNLDGHVPATLYFMIDEEKRIYGAIHIRYKLNEQLLKAGGHIGYGIRPSERRKGYAALMLSLALPIAEKLGIEEVLITCDKVNIGSAKTITKNGGVLENEVLDDGEIVQRYWIKTNGGNNYE